jgi:hypothetical protein
VISQVLRKGPNDIMSVDRQLNGIYTLLTVVSVSAKGIYHVMGQAEWNHLWFFEGLALLKSV